MKKETLVEKIAVSILTLELHRKVTVQNLQRRVTGLSVKYLREMQNVSRRNVKGRPSDR